MFRRISIIVIVAAFVVIFFTVAHLTVAQDLGLNYGANLGLSDTGGHDIRDTIVNIVKYALTFLGIIAVVMLMYSGFLWMTAGGDPAKVQKAKKILIAAIIGLIIILAAFAIVAFVIDFTTGTLEGRCTPGDTRGCGCGNMGTQTCNAGETWDPCPPVCVGATPCCCGGICDVCPCPSIPAAFTVNAFQPPDGATNEVRNRVARTIFSHNVDSGTVDGNFRLIKTAGTGILADGANCAGDPYNCASDNCDLAGTGNCVGNEAAYSDRTIAGRRISFTPFNDCPAPYTAWKCFDANATYRIEADNGAIRRAGDGAALICDFINPCTATFGTGAIIDTQNPNHLNLIISGNLCVDTINSLNAGAQDDNGIAYFEFRDDHAGLFDTDNTPVCGGVPPDVACTGAAIWNPTGAGGYAANTVYQLTLTAYDVDSNMASISRNARLRPDHCCNGILDGDETGVDCGGACAGCSGAACGTSLYDDCVDSGTDCHANDTRCASGFCACSAAGTDCEDVGYDTGIDDCCLCQDAPIIDWITPWGGFCYDDFNQACSADGDCSAADGVCEDLVTACTDGGGECGTGSCLIGCDADIGNGAVGNLVTIGGRFFGTAVGTVRFNGNVVQLASDVNPDCVNSWQNNQIIAVVPGGLPLGAGTIIAVEAAGGYSDATDDGRGPLVDFIVNTIARPGLCLLDPDHGVLNDPLTYYGINLLNNNAYFGNNRNNVAALNSNFAMATQGTAQTPNLQSGLMTTFTISPSNVLSNYLYFTKDPEAGVDELNIISFEPASGAPGQYITIFGTGFGNRQGNSSVHFGDSAGPEAVYDFPDVCADSIWRSNQIIVKVPTIVNGPYLLTVAVGGDTDDTSDLSPSQLTVNDALPLLPSLCKIEPIMGPNFTPVSLWGEYFDNFDNAGADTSRVRFYLNHDQFGAAIISWGSDGDADKIDTTVHQQAVTGPVRVVKGLPAVVGNGLNFTVGECASNADCGGTNVCCPAGTTEAGRCHADIDDCYTAVEAAVFEWDFSTGQGGGELGDPCQDAVTAPLCPAEPACQSSLFCDPNTCTCQIPCDSDGDLAFCDLPDDNLCPANYYCSDVTCLCVPGSYDSCQGRSQDLGRCDLDFCPNSPGMCSPYGGGNPYIMGGCADADCVNFGACGAGACTYNNNLNRCANGDSCDLPNYAVTDIHDNTIYAYCALYNSSPRWHVNTTASCPVSPRNAHSWTSIGSGRCIEDGTTCDLCASGFSCLNDGGTGICGVNQAVCPADAPCVSGQCTGVDRAMCECCCEIGQDARDCCEPLTCEGDCGTDATGPDTDTFGHCSGCRIESAPGVVDQAASDQACNCFGQSGKYCDIGDPDYQEGICRDCEILSTTADCQQHTSACCVDNMNSDACRGGDGTVINGLYPGQGYCAYYECLAPPDEAECDRLNPDLSGEYRSSYNCESGCASSSVRVPPPGRPCYDEDDDVCDLPCPDYYPCLGASGCEDDIAPWPDGCGNSTTNVEDCRCCCNPINDECNLVNPPWPLVCTPNTSPCTGDNRGLCCGCEEDLHCSTPATWVGCGYDTCCHMRPSVISTTPLDVSGNICRNTVMSAEFDELMDIGSFSGNVIVVGNYYGAPCPAGTVYLAQAGKTDKKSLITRAWYQALRLINRLIQPLRPEHLAQAYTAPSSLNNYCAISGSVTGHHTAAATSILEFRPSRLLDGARIYYVIIKGDEDLDSNTGVRNQWGIAMNGDISEAFNGITYTNAYLWSFITMSEQAANHGVCELDHVDVRPSSYLFTTTENDRNEVDLDATATSFDTVRDSDKVFAAYAKASNNQIISPAYDDNENPMYVWEWRWEPANDAVADIVDVPNLNDDDASENRSLIRASDNITDGNTLITATARITVDNYNDPSTEDREIPGSAQVYVFICQNPWPPIAAGGTWEPWADTDINCTVLFCSDGTGGCEGIEIGYECDDGSGTCGGCYNTNYKMYYCRDQGQSATADDLPAIVSGNTVIRGNTGDIFKEAYYFREDVPPALTDLIITDLQIGNSVRAEWPRDIINNPTGYTLYWGPSSNNYTDSQRQAGHFSPYQVSGLTNGITYYFNVTSYYDTGAESEFWGETEGTPTDQIAPAIPTGLTAEPGGEEIELGWNANTDDTESYVLYYGVQSGGPYGFSEDMGADTAVIIAGLTNGSEYCFVVTAVDGDDNESGQSSEVCATPFAMPANLTVTDVNGLDIDLSWNLNGDGVNIIVRWGNTSGGPYPDDSDSALSGTDVSYTASVSTPGLYYFIVESSNGVDIAVSNEASVIVAP